MSVGETRRFNLRAIRADVRAAEEEPVHSFHVFDGDVITMFADCQDSFQHSVMKAEGEGNNGARASLVFKRSLPQAKGRRGHGVPKGQGPRAAKVGGRG